MHAEELAIARGKYLFHRGRRGNYFFQTIDGAAFEINAKKHGYRRGGLRVAKQLPRLSWFFYIAGEQNHPAGLKRAQRGAQLAVDRQPVIAENQ